MNAGLDVADTRDRVARAVGPGASELVAREDVLRLLDEWADDDEMSPILLVLGGPGVGKSAILRKWVDARKSEKDKRGDEGEGNAGDDTRREQLVVHAIHRAQDPAAVAISLIEQCHVIAGNPAGAPPTADRPHLTAALQRAADGRRLIVVLDGLDEVADLARLRELLPDRLSPRVRLLCSSRPRYEENAGLGKPPYVSILDLDGKRWATSNEQTCVAFWQQKQTKAAWLSDAMVDSALRLGQGNMLYAAQVWRLWRSLPRDEREGTDIPPDLDSVVEHTWQRIAPLSEIRGGLCVLALARDTLQIAHMARLAGWPEDAEAQAALRERFLDQVRPILRGDDAEGYSLYHGALAEALQRRIPDHERTSWHRRMLPILDGWLRLDNRRLREYAERHLLDHCIQAESWPEAIELCLRQSFCERWLCLTDSTLAAKTLARLAGMPADGERKQRISRLARLADQRQGNWLHECAQVWKNAEPPRVPEPRPTRRILLATASPALNDPLALKHEVKAIKAAWERLGQQLGDFEHCGAADFGDLRRAFNDRQQEILHIACHGANGRLKLEFEPEQNFTPGPDNFVRLVRALGKSLVLVVLNCCDSAGLAERLTQDGGVPLAVGMTGDILDTQALRFSSVFHDRLAFGYVVQDAFDEAVQSLEGIDRDFPKLFASSSEARQTRLVGRLPERPQEAAR